MVLLQMVERGVERRLIAVTHEFGDEGVKAGFPEPVLDPASGREEREGEADELVGIRGNTFCDSRAHISTKVNWWGEPLIVVVRTTLLSCAVKVCRSMAGEGVQSRRIIFSHLTCGGGIRSLEFRSFAIR